MRVILVFIALAALAGCEHYPTMAELEAEERELLRQIAEEEKASPPSASASDYSLSPDVLAETYERAKSTSVSVNPAAQPAAAKPDPPPSKWAGRGWEKFGDWYVKALHDDMDLVTRVRLFTEFELSERPSAHLAPYKKDLGFGFSIFGGSLVTTSHSIDLGGRDRWPFCENDLSTASVDGAKVVQVATIPAGGSCNRVDPEGDLISQFKSGQSAKLRVRFDDGEISLNGFSGAWSRAKELGQR